MRLGRRGRSRDGSPLSKRALLQHVNTELAALAAGGAPLAVYCECGRDECILSIDVAREEFAAARAHPSSALVIPEHAGPSTRVLERFESFVVVPAEPLDADRVPDGLEL